jgi:hypothetical protein
MMAARWQRQIVENKYSEAAIKENAGNKLREMFCWKPMAERWGPVVTELGWVLGGSVNPSEHHKILPEFRCSTRALVTSLHDAGPQPRRASVCGSAAALRSGSVPAVTPPALHFSRSPTADRSR